MPSGPGGLRPGRPASRPGEEVRGGLGPGGPPGSQGLGPAERRRRPARPRAASGLAGWEPSLSPGAGPQGFASRWARRAEPRPPGGPAGVRLRPPRARHPAPASPGGDGERSLGSARLRRRSGEGEADLLLYALPARGRRLPQGPARPGPASSPSQGSDIPVSLLQPARATAGSPLGPAGLRRPSGACSVLEGRSDGHRTMTFPAFPRIFMALPACLAGLTSPLMCCPLFTLTHQSALYCAFNHIEPFVQFLLGLKVCYIMFPPPEVLSLVEKVLPILKELLRV